MRRLFEQYTQNGFGLDGNIVRSITPVAGIRNGRNVLVFKLHAIRQDEQIVRAELHFNQRHKTNPLKWQDRRVFEAAASCGSCLSRGISMLPLERLPTPSKQWLSWEARDMVDDALRSNTSELVVELTRKGHYLHPDVLIKRHTPFLLVYSGSKSLLDKSKLPIDLLQQHSTTPAYESSEEGSDEDLGHFMRRRSKRSIGASSGNYYAYSNQDMATEDYKQRKAQVEEFRRNGPKVLKTRKNKKIRHRKPPHYDPDDPMMGFGTEPDDTKASTDQNIHSNSISDSPDPNELSMFLLDGASHHLEKQSGCARRDMIVDFRDIGWEDWIIAPKSFEAHYCAGSCPYPLESVCFFFPSSPLNQCLNLCCTTVFHREI
uniref:TGF-beta family profile domain-containing protein n=1 Tax=Acrobeloides nanus TaxID=290746 RepID=A0A914CD45_9BILA